jgi:inosine-uridine nucleoside N-ribohydrolase
MPTSMVELRVDLTNSVQIRKGGRLALLLVTILAIIWVTDAQARSVRTLLITTDCGCDIDDQFVLMHTLTSPAFQVMGIVTTHAPNLYGNDLPTKDKTGAPLALSEITAAQAHEVMNQLPPKYTRPIFAGSSLALASRTAARPNQGVQFILDTAQKYDSHHRLTILALGAVTDIASALIVDPSLQNRIEIVAMGFNAWPKGGDGFNIKNDVKGWQILMDSNVPISIADGAVSIRDLAMDREKSAKLFRTAKQECT